MYLNEVYSVYVTSRTIGDYLGEALCTFIGDLITSQIEYQQRTIQPQALYRHEQHGTTW